ncbi:MAG: DNA polymerase I, partial [Acidobacteria bacterium]
ASLAAMERERGGEEAEDLAARFEAAAGLAARGTVPARELKKILAKLGQKTQPKAWLAVAANEEALDLSRRLVRVRTDAPVTLDLEAMRPGHPDVAAALALFRRLGFRRLVEELEQEPSAAVPEPPALTVREPADGREAAALLRALRRAERIGVAVAAVPGQGRGSPPEGVALSAAAGEAVYIPLAGRRVPRALPALLGAEGPPKVGHDLKEAMHRLAEADLDLGGLAFDTMLAGALLEPSARERSAEDLAARVLGERVRRPPPPRKGGQASLAEVDGSGAPNASGAEAAVLLPLADELARRLDEHGLTDLFREIEMPLVPVLWRMERHGIRLDRARLAELSERLGREIARLEGEIHALAGHPFNVNSPAQLRKVLFEELKLSPTGRRTVKTRAHSTGQEALEALALEHELPAKVLEYRELAKLKSTYVDALPQFVSERTGRLHTRFHQLGAATGRLSSSDPNLQNIPVRTELGRTIRAAFVPEPGWKFLSADYSQMELRILAHLAGDERLAEAFRKDLDIHRYTASLVFGVPLEEVTPEMRSRAKAVNFGIIYGMSEFRLAREQKMTREEARAFIDAYFERYPDVKRYIDGVIAEVKQTGEVRTLFGRVRFFPELTGAAGGRRLSHAVREQLLRQAVNTTVQGSAADIVKMAMVRVARRLESGGFRSRLLLQVHDELLIEVPSEEVAPVARLVREEMESVARLDVPLKVDIGTADNWAETH